MKSYCRIIFVLVVFAQAASGQIDTSYNVQKVLMEALSKSAAEIVTPGNDDEDDDDGKPITLEYLIEHPSNIMFLKIDLRATPIKKLPAGFDNLSDLTFIIITNLPAKASFDFEDAINTISGLSSVKDLYIINNGRGFRTIPSSIGQMTNLKRFVCYNNALETLPTEIGNLENLEELSLEMNRLSSLPPSLGKLKALKRLGLDENPLERSQCGKLEALLPGCNVTCAQPSKK